MSNTRATSALILWICGAAHVMADTTTAAEVLCQCRDPDGKRRDIGTVDCFSIGGRPTLLRCDMSTNTPYWKKVESVQGCPTA